MLQGNVVLVLTSAQDILVAFRVFRKGRERHTNESVGRMVDRRVTIDWRMLMYRLRTNMAFAHVHLRFER